MRGFRDERQSVKERFGEEGNTKQRRKDKEKWRRMIECEGGNQRRREGERA